MALEIKDDITVRDKDGFVYNVTIKHHPATGVSIAYYNDARIASREYGRMLPPTSDDDKEWEEWEERFREWADGSITDLRIECKQYFDNNRGNIF